MVIIEEFVISKEINNRCIALSQKKIVLANLSIAVNFSKCEKTLCFLYKSKKEAYNSFYKNIIVEY